MSRPALKPLISERKIQKRVRELAGEIARDHAGEELAVLALMDGAFVFVADLVRHLDLPGLRLHFVRAASYGGRRVSSGRVELGTMPDLSGRRVLIVDDILDTGRTLAAARRAVEGALEVKTCVLLDKPTRRVPEGLQVADYIGFTVPDVFVVGYGLDWDGRLRHLPELLAVAQDGEKHRG
jgi:hypoxanthine phosphoribosyltransferase